jgi:hypothetical protein
MSFKVRNSYLNKPMFNPEEMQESGSSIQVSVLFNLMELFIYLHVFQLRYTNYIDLSCNA